MKILCYGSRTWTDVETVMNALVGFQKNTTIVCGMSDAKCVGVGSDWICCEIAKQLGYSFKTHQQEPFNDKGLQFDKNTKVITSENIRHDPVTLCYVFSDSDQFSALIQDCINKCHCANIPVRIVRSSKWRCKWGNGQWKQAMSLSG